MCCTVSRIRTPFRFLKSNLGNIANLDTSVKTSIVDAINAAQADIDDAKADLGALDPGLSQQAREELLTCFRHVRWHDDDADYYAALVAALQIGDPTRPITANVPQIGTRTTDGFISLYGSVKDHRGIIVSSNSASGHTIPYYNESSGAYDAESPYYPIPIPVGAQEYWLDGSIENMYAYSCQVVQWNASTGRWDIALPGQYIWTDALVTSDTPHSQLTPYHQDISAFNNGTYYMVLGIAKSNGRTRWDDTETIRRTFPDGAYLAQMDNTATGIVDTSIANLALRFSF